MVMISVWDKGKINVKDEFRSGCSHENKDRDRLIGKGIPRLGRVFLRASA